MAEKKENMQYGTATVQRQGNSFTQTGSTGIKQSTASPRMNPQHAEQIRNLGASIASGPSMMPHQALGLLAGKVGNALSGLGQANRQMGNDMRGQALAVRQGASFTPGWERPPERPAAGQTSATAASNRGLADARQPQGGQPNYAAAAGFKKTDTYTPVANDRQSFLNQTVATGNPFNTAMIRSGAARNIYDQALDQGAYRWDDGKGGYLEAKEGRPLHAGTPGTFSVVGDGGSRFGLTPEDWNGMSQQERSNLVVQGLNQDIAAMQDLNATRRQAAGLGPQQGQQGRNQGQGLAGPQGYDWGGELQDFLSGRPRPDNMFSNLTRMIENSTAVTADGVRVHTAESKALQAMLGQMMAGIGGGIEDEMGMRGGIDPEIAMMQDRMNADWQKQLMDEAYRRDKLTQEGYQADRSAWLDYAKAMQPKGLSTVDMPMYGSNGEVVGTQPAGAFFDPRAGWQVQPLGMNGPDILED